VIVDTIHTGSVCTTSVRSCRERQLYHHL